MVLSVDGREYTRLHIYDYRITLETLDGDGTGRSKAFGWPMIRDPQGSIINLKIQAMATDSKNPDFIHLWAICKSMGSTDFVRVKFVDPTGSIIDQNMYLVLGELRTRKIEENGKVYTDAISVNFIAEKG